MGEQPFSSNSGETTGLQDIRRRRRHTAVNSVVSIVLACFTAVMINLINVRLYGRGPISTRVDGELSEQTRHILESAEGDIELTAFFEADHPFFVPVRALLQEYLEASRDMPNLRILINTIDPIRDVALAAEVSRKYSAPPNTLIVSSQSGSKLIKPDDMKIWSAANSDGIGIADFSGEGIVASAIWNVTHFDHPVIYFLVGNGEHSPDDYDRLNGYSVVARHLKRVNYIVKTLNLSESQSVPNDCDVLVIAGPRTVIGVRELEKLGTYLASSGKMLILLDSASDDGIANLLNGWGLKIVSPSTGTAALASGAKVVTGVGDHPISQVIKNANVVMQPSCVFEITPEALEAGHLHKPRATVLATINMDAIVASRYVPEVAAVAVERGSRSGVSDGFLSRIVAVGNAQFASNALTTGGYNSNLDFFLSSIYWLSERENLVGKTPVSYRILRSGISKDMWPQVTILVVVAWPLSIFLIGLVLTCSRRRG